MEICPKCGKEHLAPTGKVALDDKGSVREFRCDSTDCNMKKVSVGIGEDMSTTDRADLVINLN